MTKFWAMFRLAFLLCVAGDALAAVAPSWAEVALDQRCEGLLEFLKSTTAPELKEWSLNKPQCVISGSAAGDITWSLDGAWQKGSKRLPLRYVVSEARTRKPSVYWCVVKEKKAGCSTPWGNAFSEGELYSKPEAAKAAFEGVLAISPGFLSLASKLDDWVGKSGAQTKIFELSYDDWMKAWAKSARSLPTKDGLFVAEYTPDRESLRSGLVTAKNAIPSSLRECLGCASTPCDKAPISYEFNGLGLSLTRVLTPEEQKTSGQKSAKASWVIVEATPFVAGKPKWPFLCGEHRFNIQKI